MKSQFRQLVEQALDHVGVDYSKNHVFHDKRKTGRRIKFAWLEPTEEQIDEVRRFLERYYGTGNVIVGITDPQAGRAFGFAVRVIEQQ